MSEAVATGRRWSFEGWRRATFLALLVGYMGYYLCRQNLSVALTPMEAAGILDKRGYGLITSTGTLFYAIGKLATGGLADSRGGRAMFLLGLWGSVVASVFFGVSTGAIFFVGFWVLNRFFQSMGWAGLVQVVVRWFTPLRYGTAMGLMSTSYQLGGVVATLFAGALLSIGLGWRMLFVVPAVLLALIGLFCHAFIKGSPAEVGYELPREEAGAERSAPSIASSASAWARYAALLSRPTFLGLCLLSFTLTLLREIFNTWMPSYFAALGATASIAAFKSALFPALGVAGTLLAGWLSDGPLRGRRMPLVAASIVLLTATLAGLALLEPLSLRLGFSRDLVALVLVGATGFFLLAPYSMVGGGVVACDAGGKEAAATAAGLLDGMGYFAAVLAGTGVAEVVMRAGWTTAYLAMAALSAASALVCAALLKASPRS
jgi:sugar phosphate permease